ncbi:ATP-binding protein [Paenibacillus massiliensis]|uniref:ATP-binding protein n=1 Tax=Paenibacillus massiliensis TaxID=225917 RepID=UPI00046FDBF1|nr:ATP-binding protein [Paenibacillus massiliensis]
MECVIFIGIQASGKSTFYKEQFFTTHMRINLDMLRTRYREHIFVEAALKGKQAFVVDNTNPAVADRQKYIAAAKEHHFKVVGYYFQPDYELSIHRNEQRQGKAKIPEIGIKSTLKNLQIPSYAEAFDELYMVRSLDNEFEVTDMIQEDLE